MLGWHRVACVTSVKTIVWTGVILVNFSTVLTRCTLALPRPFIAGARDLLHRREVRGLPARHGLLREKRGCSRSKTYGRWDYIRTYTVYRMRDCRQCIESGTVFSGVPLPKQSWRVVGR